MRESRWHGLTRIALVIALFPTSAAAQSWYTLIDDEFIVPEGASLVGHVPETNLPGGTWSLGGAPGLIVHNQAVHPTGLGPLEAYATIDARVSDAEVGLYLFGSPYTPTDQVAGGVIFRYVDATNYMLVFYRNQGLWLWKRTPGGFVHIAYASVDSPVLTWRWMSVRAIGSSITVNWHGVDKIAVTDSTNQTATRHGFWFYSAIDSQSVIGTFRVRSQQPMQPPAVTSITTTPNPLDLPIASSTVVTATGYSANNVVVPTATFTWTSSDPSVAWIQSTTQNTAKVVASAVGNSTITVTAQSGSATFSKTITATVTNTTAQVSQTLIYDDFIAPENTNLTDHLPETNLSQGTWAVGGSPSLVINNQAVHPTGAGSFDAYATIDSKTPDAAVGIYWRPSIYQPQPAGGVIFRWVSPTNYLLAHHWQEYVQLWKMTPTGFVFLANAHVGVPSDAWHWMQIRGVGSSLTVNWDGVDRIQFTDATNLFATRHGIWSWSSVDPVATIGTFDVQGTLPEPVASVVVTPNAVTIPSGGAAVLTAKAYGAGGTYVPAAFTWEVGPNAEVLSVQSTGANTAKVGGGVFTGSVPVTATIVGGSASGSAEVTVVEKCLSLCVWDGFNGTGLLQAHSPETNVMDDPWEVVGGPNIVVSTTRALPSPTGAGSLALGTIDGGNANGVVSAEWLPQSSEYTNPTFGLIARYVSNEEYFVAIVENHRLKLFRRYPGGITQIGDAAVHDDLGVSHTMQVRLDGPGIQVWWDDVQRIQAIDATNIDATRHGLYFDVSKDASSFVENFIFVGTNKSIAASMQVSSTTINTVAQAYPLFLNADSFTAGNTWIPWTSFTWHSSNSAIAFVEQLDHRSARVVGLASGSVTITAISEQGLTATFQVLVTVPESDGTVRVFDAFEGSIHTFLSNHLPNRYITGAAWATNGAGNIRINDVNSIFPLRHIEIEHATIESGTANGTVSANWKPLNANIYSNGGVVFRYVNNESYWYAYVMQHGLHLKKVIGSVHTTVASVGIANPTGAIHQIAVLLDGPRIQVWFDGVLQFEVSDPMNESATRHGVMFHSAFDGASNIDDFSVNTEFITPVYPPQPILPCVNGVWPPSGQHWHTAGGTDAVTLSAPFECAWTATSTVPWIHLPATSGVGDAYVEYSIGHNPSGPRQGAIAFDNGWFYPVTQAGTGDIADPTPTPGGETVRLAQAPTVIASIAPNGTPTFAQAPQVAVSHEADGIRYAVPKQVLVGTRLGFLDPATFIHWATWPDGKKTEDECFGNCGEGCKATLLGGLVPAPCGSPDYWELHLLSARTSPTLVGVETREECIGPDAFLNEYDVYTGTVQWTYFGIWTQSCEDHDFVMRQNPIDGAIGVLPFIFGICGGPNEARTWSYTSLEFGLKMRSSTSLPAQSQSCPQILP